MKNHGTRAMYCRGGCRCESCTEANTDYDRAYHNRPIRNEKKQWVNTSVAISTDPVTNSERAIESERHKRRVEKEIELNLREQGETRDERPFKFVPLGRFLREPKGGVSHWGTW